MRRAWERELISPLSLSVSLCSGRGPGVGTQGHAVQKKFGGVGRNHQMQHGQKCHVLHYVRVLLRSGWPRRTLRRGRLVITHHENCQVFLFILKNVTPGHLKKNFLDGLDSGGMWCKRCNSADTPLPSITHPAWAREVCDGTKSARTKRGSVVQIRQTNTARYLESGPKITRPNPNCCLLPFLPHRKTRNPPRTKRHLTTSCENSHGDSARPAFKNTGCGM